MKKILLLIGIVILCSSSHNSSKGRLFCLRNNIELGKIDLGQSINCVFLLKNIGTEPVEILYYKASCNCTEVKINKKNINPNDTLKVSLLIDTKEKYPGYHSSTVILKTNGERTFYDLWANFEVIKGRINSSKK